MCIARHQCKNMKIFNNQMKGQRDIKYQGQLRKIKANTVRFQIQEEIQLEIDQYQQTIIEEPETKTKMD